MSELLEKLIEDARALSPTERATLVDNLLQDPGSADPEWESAWLAECERRMTSIDDPASATPWEAVRWHVFDR